MLQVALEAPLGHSGLTSTVLDSFELSEPPAPAAVRRIISLGGRRQRAAFLQSLSPPARARAEAGGGADGERRRVLRGLGSVGWIEKSAQAGSTRQVAVRGARRWLVREPPASSRCKIAPAPAPRGATSPSSLASPLDRSIGARAHYTQTVYVW